MAKLNLVRILTRLIKGGISPRYARRTVAELADHIGDLKNQALDQGMADEKADDWAYRQIGDEDTLVREVLDKPELKSWLSTHAGVALLLGPLVTWLGVMLLFIGVLVVLNLFTPLLNYAPGTEIPDSFKFLFEVLTFTVLHLTAPVLVIASVIAAKTRLLRLGWQLVLGIVVLAFFGAAWGYHLNWPTQSEQGIIQFSWGYSFMWDRISDRPDPLKYGKLLGMLVLGAATWYWYDPYRKDRARTA